MKLPAQYASQGVHSASPSVTDQWFRQSFTAGCLRASTWGTPFRLFETAAFGQPIACSLCRGSAAEHTERARILSETGTRWTSTGGAAWSLLGLPAGTHHSVAVGHDSSEQRDAFIGIHG